MRETSVAILVRVAGRLMPALPLIINSESVNAYHHFRVLIELKLFPVIVTPSLYSRVGVSPDYAEQCIKLLDVFHFSYIGDSFIDERLVITNSDVSTTRPARVNVRV